MAAGPLPGPGPLPDEPNPFSFREFVRSKTRGGVGDGTGGDPPVAPWAAERPANAVAGAALSPPPGPAVLPLPAAPGDEEEEEEEEEEEWSDSYRPLEVERVLLGAAGPQPGHEQLKEENAALRSKISKLQILSEAQAEKMRKLEKKLEENKIKEEKEAQDLEAMVQHVEQNLQLMTKRAVKAETCAAKLRQENALLQAQLRNYQSEVEALRAAQAGLAVAKQNAEVALEQLLRVTATSRSSLRQLLSGAESLQLVADLLRSIDRISEVSEDGQ